MTVDGDNLAELGTLPVPPLAPCAIDPEFGWIAWADDEGKRLGRCHADARPEEQNFPAIPLPDRYQVTALAFHRQVLFAGGNCGKEVVGWFDFAEASPTWQPLPIPEEFRRYGKTVDALLVDDNRLIAVDDVVMPKYLLLYDITDPRAAKPGEPLMEQIPAHSSYEHIFGAALGKRWFALLSSSMNHGWAGLHIALYDRRRLGEVGTLTATRAGSFRGEDVQNWRGVGFCDDVLLIAAGPDGVGLLDLSEVGHLATRDEHRFWTRSDEFQAIAETLTYRPMPAGVEVVRVDGVPGQRRMLVVIQHSGTMNSVLMDV